MELNFSFVHILFTFVYKGKGVTNRLLFTFRYANASYN